MEIQNGSTDSFFSLCFVQNKSCTGLSFWIGIDRYGRNRYFHRCKLLENRSIILLPLGRCTAFDRDIPLINQMLTWLTYSQNYFNVTQNDALVLVDQESRQTIYSLLIIDKYDCATTYSAMLLSI